MSIEERKRKNTIYYFLAVAKAQQDIQQLQQNLVLYLRFNPFALYKKINNKQTLLTSKRLKHYLVYEGNIKYPQAIQNYFKKHNFSDLITCEQLLSSILPYTPDVLRNIKNSIPWQLEQNKLVSKEIEIAYIQIVKRQIYHILKISSLREDVFPKGGYSDMKKFILKDLKNYGTTKDKKELETVDLMIIRKWLEIWISIDEFQILNIMRWFQGEDEKNIARIFGSVNVNMEDIKCLCEDNQKQKQRKLTKIKSPKKKSRNLDYYQPRKYNIKQMKQTQVISLWCQYIYIILKSQKDMRQKRQKIEEYQTQAAEVIKTEIISKKKSFTAIKKIISFVQKYIDISSFQLKRWQEHLSCLSLENSVLFKIFYFEDNSPLINTQNTIDIAIKKDIAFILKTYCQAKYQLIKISKQVVQKEIGQKMFKILMPSKKQYMTAKTLRQVLQQMAIEYEQQQFQILMKHFGDGKIITSMSFKNVFMAQGS